MTQAETYESVQVVLEAFRAVEERDERRLLELYLWGAFIRFRAS